MNAPGRSCFNPVERSLAYITKKTTGVTLPIFSKGVHIISREVPEELEELEKENVNCAMQILRELWEQVRVNEKNMLVDVVLAAEEELNELITKVLQYKKSPASLKQDGILISLFYFYFWFLFLCYLFFLC